MEQRYQQKLEYLSSSSATQSRTNSYIDTQQNERASWHGIEANEIAGPPISKTAWSDSKESLSSVADNNSCHRTGHNLEEVYDFNRVQQPKLADFRTDATDIADNGIHDRIQEYKTKMMEYLMEKAELQMVSMEKEYEKKLQETHYKSSNSSPKINSKSSETFV